MKVAVIGSRGFTNKDLLYSVLNDLKKYGAPSDKISVIVSGGAAGADSLAETYAKEKRIETTIYLPEYKRYGRGAPLKRNVQIIQDADLIIAFWDGKSPGTKHSINEATERKKKVIIINP